MESNASRYLEAIKRLPKRTKIGICFVFALFVIVIVGYFIYRKINYPVGDTLVTVSNYDSNAGIPKDYKDAVNAQITSIVLANTNINELYFTDAVIREGTYEEKTTNDVHSAKYIIDIDSLHYSFLVNVVWAGDQLTDDPDISVSCPHYMDVIYTDKKCVIQTPIQQVQRYLPHYGRVDNVKYGVTLVSESSINPAYLQVEVPACGDASLFEKAVDDTKQWLKKIYLDPNDYSIQTKNVCKE